MDVTKLHTGLFIPSSNYAIILGSNHYLVFPLLSETNFNIIKTTYKIMILYIVVNCVLYSGKKIKL
jgi:hypothetical protein